MGKTKFFFPSEGSAGESLITVLMVVAIMSVVMTSSMYLFENLFKSQKSLTAKSNAESLVSEIKMALSSGNVCKLNLIGKIAPAAGTSTVLSVTTLKYLDATGLALGSADIVRTGNSGVNVVSMEISDTQVVGPNALVGKFTINLNTPGVMGVSAFARSAPIRIDVGPGNAIIDCKMMGGTSGAGGGDCAPASVPWPSGVPYCGDGISYPVPITGYPTQKYSVGPLPNYYDVSTLSVMGQHLGPTLGPQRSFLVCPRV